MKHEESLYLLIVIALSGSLVAATNPASFGMERVYLYLYWLVRFAIEGGLFLAFRSLLETGQQLRRRPLILMSLAFVSSLIPFVLATTALDIVLGFPELGLGQAPSDGVSFIREFLFEVTYLADDHLFLCLLLSLPRLLNLLVGEAAPKSPLSAVSGSLPTGPQLVLPMLDPPLNGTVIRLEAQEHYVIVVATGEQRMVLGRFSDFVATLPSSEGQMVHRSHWVAYNAASEVFQENRNMKLRLINGDVVPVSRRYRDAASKILDR
jgi:hypothetical protein